MPERNVELQLGHVEDLLESLKDNLAEAVKALDTRLARAELSVRGLEDREVRRSAIADERERLEAERRRNEDERQRRIEAAQVTQRQFRQWQVGQIIATLAVIATLLAGGHVL